MNFFQEPFQCLVSDQSMTYYRGGKGETVIFVHGITTYSFIWRKIIPYFINQYDVITIDLIACGDSDKPLNTDISLKQQSKFLEEFVEKLQINKFHLVSHDVGGGIAQIFTVNNAKLLHSVTLINPVAYNFWPVQPISAMQTPIIRQIAMASLDAGMFKLMIKRGLYNKSSLNEELLELFWKPLRTKIGRKAFLSFAKNLDNRNLTEIENEIRQITIPILIIRAEADLYLSAAISEKLHKEIKTSKLVKITEGGHFVQEDEPQKVAAYILEFISQND